MPIRTILSLFLAIVASIGLAAVENHVVDARENSYAFCNGRLTLTTGLPVTTSDVTAATTVYFTPFRGNRISLYSGSNWQLLSFSEISVAVPAIATRPFDIFAYNNGGTVALEATSWTDDSTRATALTTQDGVYVKTGATTRRYLGTGRSVASGQTEDSVVRRFLWNYYNRASRLLQVFGSGADYSYGTSSWRAQNGDTNTKVEIMTGVAETRLQITGRLIFRNSGAASPYIGICEGAGISNCNSAIIGYSNSTIYAQVHTDLQKTPAAGYHSYTLVEYGIPNSIFYGASGFGSLQGDTDS